MKILSFLLGLFFAFATFTSVVDAYGSYGYNTLPRYGYQESTDYFGNYNVNSFTGKTDFFSQNTGTQSRNFMEQYFGSGALGYNQNTFQNYNQNSNVDASNGYDFTKGPCATEKIRGNFRGKDNDFTITREVCDNIEGNFYKTDSYNQNYGASGSQNTLAFDNQVYNNQYTNEYALDNDFTNRQASSSTQNIYSTSFGKGTRIVLN
ncbi:MAG: hypothetical protein AABX72_02550 [Nanoarchaeota archaeon]